jgi:energy-coupling factor transporter ATP-binding protein EcfA2
MSASDAVRLEEISEANNVNAIRPDGSLTFCIDGLTVAYGANGSGKSGYSRILKRLCRTRGEDEPVLPDVRKETPGIPTATINYMVGSRKHSVPWTGNVQDNPDLLRVAVFDSKAAGRHIGKPNDVAYVPEGLELFEALADAARKIARKIEPACTQLEDERVSRTFLTRTLGTRVENAVRRIGTKGADKELRDLAANTTGNSRRVDEIRSLIAELKTNNPEKLAKKYIQQADSWQRLLNRATSAYTKLSRENLIKAVELRKAYATAAEAAAAATSTLNNEPLPKTGEAAWKVLWQAARSFYSSAYPGQKFPAEENGDRCPLCQQILDFDSKLRFSRFEHFVSDHTQQDMRRLEQTMREAQGSLQEIAGLTDADDTQLDELEYIKPELANQLRSTLIRLTPRRAYFEAILAGDCDPSIVSPTDYYAPDLNSAEYMSFIEERHRAASNLDTEQVATQIKQLEQEAQDLQACSALDSNIEALILEHTNRMTASALRRACKDCATNGMTQKQGILSAEIVTKALKDRFQSELQELGASSVCVELERHSNANGVTYHQIVIRGAEHKNKAEHILSEGEQRIVALAGFLADLATTEDTSALIFDDPVCSLDHDYRRCVAARLVNLSLTRQVIIFTHDLSFLCYLYEAADSMVTELSYREIFRASGSTGYTISDLPTYGVPAKRRIGSLKQEIQNRRKQESEHPIQWRVTSSSIADRLRKSWERAVEEVLLGCVVQRFVKDVQTSRLKNLHIDQADAETVSKSMTRLSNWVHDGAAEMNPPCATANELDTEVKRLEAWITEVSRRKK